MTSDVVRILVAAASQQLLVRLFDRCKPIAEMVQRSDDKTATFTVPRNRMEWFLGVCKDLGITCTSQTD